LEMLGETTSGRLNPQPDGFRVALHGGVFTRFGEVFGGLGEVQHWRGIKVQHPEPVQHEVIAG